MSARSETFNTLERRWFADGGELYTQRVRPSGQDAGPKPGRLVSRLLLFVPAMGLGFAVSMPLVHRVSVPCELRAVEDRLVTAGGAATVVDVRVKVGQWVKKGELLARLELASGQSKLDEVAAREQDLVARRVELESVLKLPETVRALARRQQLAGELERLSRELPRGRTPAARRRLEQRVAAGRNALGLAEQRLPTAWREHAKVESELAGLLARRTKLAALRRVEVRAPRAGEVTSVDVQKGAGVAPGTQLMRLADTRALRTVGFVDSDSRWLLRQGQPIVVHRPDGTSVTGVVVALNPHHDRITGRTRLRVEGVVHDPARSLGEGAGDWRIEGRRSLLSRWLR